MRFCNALRVLKFVLAAFVSSSFAPKAPATSPIFRCDNGKITLTSEAPLEVIKARSNKLKGVVDAEKRTFAWTIDIADFEGFNCPLQREHFNENYLESELYPAAYFRGKLIEDVDLSRDGDYSVRAKGRLAVHGVSQERIIKTSISVKGKKMRARADFMVPLSDHDITVPRLVHQKIAEEIAVSVDAELTAQ